MRAFQWRSASPPTSRADAVRWPAMSALTRSAVVERVGGRGLAAFAVVYVIWGSTYFFIRLAIETMPPLLMAGVRYVVAGSVLLAITSRLPGGAQDRIGLRQWRAAAITGGLLLLGVTQVRSGCEPRAT